MSKLYCGSCLDVLPTLPDVRCIFADPFDNIGLGYKTYKDKMPDEDYEVFLEKCVRLFCHKADIVWMSFNSRWTVAMGAICHRVQKDMGVEVKPCVQVFTFGQHNNNDLGNNHRPLWRLMSPGTELYPEQIKVPSARQTIYKDSRAKAGGRVPGDVFDMAYHDEMLIQALLGVPIEPGDVFDFPRVTGNSKQRRGWHPTQLHEQLVERCIKLSTKPGQSVLDPFGGTGTTLRVCKEIERPCTLIEFDPTYCDKIAAEHGLPWKQAA